ncbi:MAG: hypothetical protein RJA36_683 [Pseudomonadota bacterium]
MMQPAVPPPSKPTVLVVDDTPANLQLISHILKHECEVLLASGGEQALQLAHGQPRPDLVLLDIMMPGMDGYEVCHRLKTDPATTAIPVIFLTAKGESEDEIVGLQAGAVDYLPKPVRPPVLRARVRTQLELKLAREALARQNADLRGEIEILGVGVRGLASLAEALCRESSARLGRIQRYVQLLGERLLAQPGYLEALGGKRLQAVVRAAALYDIGKIGVSDQILNKAGALTPEELATVRSHAEIGGQALQGMLDQTVAALGGRVSASDDDDGPLAFLEIARDMALLHHERWDGSGYPRGLRGEAIPPSARLVALADAYDAMMSRRAYKAPLPAQQVREIVVAGRGSWFDPLVVDAFLDCEDEFQRIWHEHSDPQERS